MYFPDLVWSLILKFMLSKYWPLQRQYIRHVVPHLQGRELKRGKIIGSRGRVFCLVRRLRVSTFVIHLTENFLIPIEPSSPEMLEQ